MVHLIIFPDLKRATMPKQLLLMQIMEVANLIWNFQGNNRMITQAIIITSQETCLIMRTLNSTTLVFNDITLN